LNNLPFDLEELIIIRSIVKYGSFRKASFQLGISQPSITLRVRILERKIGRQIFLRKIPITLTESGIILYRYSEKILFLCEEASVTLKNLKLSKQSVTIGATQTIGTYLMPQVLGLFKKKYNNIDLTLEIHSSRKICWYVANGQIDFAIIGGKVPNELDRILEIIPYAEDELALIISKNHTLRSEKFIKKEDLYRLNFITFNKDSTIQKLINDILKDNNIDLTRISTVMELNTVEGIKNAVQSGLGASFISVSALSKELENQNLIKLKVENIFIKRTLNIVAHPLKYKNKSFQVFLNEILNTLTSLPIKIF